MIFHAICIHCFYLFAHYTFAENRIVPIRGKDFESSGMRQNFLKISHSSG